jgi:mono/diheme cytochrome c family protein
LEVFVKHHSVLIGAITLALVACSSTEPLAVGRPVAEARPASVALDPADVSAGQQVFGRQCAA